MEHDDSSCVLGQNNLQLKTDIDDESLSLVPVDLLLLNCLIFNFFGECTGCYIGNGPYLNF